MRDPNRLYKFYAELQRIHIQYFPDWRFGQLIFNVFDSRRENLWFTEEDRMISYFKEYFQFISLYEVFKVHLTVLSVIRILKSLKTLITGNTSYI